MRENKILNSGFACESEPCTDEPNWLRELAHKQTYSSESVYGERRDNEQRKLRVVGMAEVMCRASRLPCCSYRDAYLVFLKWSVRHLWLVVPYDGANGTVAVFAKWVCKQPRLAHYSRKLAPLARCSDSSSDTTWCLLAPLTKYTKRFTQFAAW